MKSANNIFDQNTNPVRKEPKYQKKFLEEKLFQMIQQLQKYKRKSPFRLKSNQPSVPLNFDSYFCSNIDPGTPSQLMQCFSNQISPIKHLSLQDSFKPIKKNSNYSKTYNSSSQKKLVDIKEYLIDSQRLSAVKQKETQKKPQIQKNKLKLINPTLNLSYQQFQLKILNYRLDRSHSMKNLIPTLGSSRFCFGLEKYFISDIKNFMYVQPNAKIMKWIEECFNYLINQVKLQHYQPSNSQQLNSSLNCGRLTFVFGLDKTLIYCQQGKRFPNDKEVTINLPNGKQQVAHYKLRPYAQQILLELSKKADIVVFSGSHQNYAEEVVKSFDTDRIVQKTLTKQDCSYLANGQLVKDVMILGKRLKDVILIDSNFSSFRCQINNCIPIIPYYGDEDDDQMLKLQNFIQEFIIGQPNVQNFLKNYFKFKEWQQESNIHDVFQNIYTSKS